MLACVILCINVTEELKKSHNTRLRNSALLKDYQMICTVVSIISGDVKTSKIPKADQLLVLSCKRTVLRKDLTIQLLQRNVNI